MPDPSPYVFISYSRRDSRVARWLQHQLESYKYQATLVQPELRPPDRVFLRPVFLDTNDLRVSSGVFWDDICAKLDLSRYLLVLCSRASAASEYVDREIARFIGEDESRLENILLVVVDGLINLSAPAAEDLPPEIFRRWDRLAARNHVLLLPAEGEKAAVARRRGLMQIISFLLGIEWTVLYNRHLIARRKQLVRLGAIGLIFLTLVCLSLAWALWKESELARFERKVFPYSLVVGYVDNFLSPLITSLEADPGKPFLIIIVMPDSYGELDHNGRVAYYREEVGKAGYHAELKKVQTSLPRGAETAVVVPTPKYYQDKQMDVYVDFASTVAAFRHVIDYKKQNAAYKRSSEDEMLREYDIEFEESVRQRLGKQQDRIVFVHSPAEALRVLTSGR